MNSSGDLYDFFYKNSQGVDLFFFLSDGVERIIKVVQYMPIEEISSPFLINRLEGRLVYNLGFGDFNEKTELIEDFILSNNGDTFKIFRTVLGTIEYFFDNHLDAVIMVQGSDGHEGFEEICRKTCSRGCLNFCKKYNRRMRLYTNDSLFFTKKL